MKKIYLLVFILPFLVYTGCSPDVVSVTVVRNPSIKFTSATGDWRSETYSFATPTKVVVYPTDTTQPGKFYNRLVLQATGKDAGNNQLQLVVTFDAIDVNQLVGSYTPLHNLQRGLAQVQLYNLTNPNNLLAYELCTDNTTPSIFQIQKQSQSERLISGTFQITLCNIRDTTEKINLTAGTLTDISY